MALFAIADLHLSTLNSTDKSMEVFGSRWQDYMSRLKSNWERLVSDDDTVVISGDISWALSLEEAQSDLKFIDSLPGKKILGKGNHDFWWTTVSKHRKMFEKENIGSISFLYNNAHEVENFIVAGTRGWYQDEGARNAPKDTDYDKLTNREVLRLRLSLNEAVRIKEASPHKEIMVFMHFPPVWSDKVCLPLVDILHEYGIGRVYFGHIHGNYTCPAEFEYEEIKMSLISADYLNFTPKILK